MPSRRAVIALLSVPVAGCSALQGDDERTVFESDIALDPGEYRAVEFELEERREVVFGISEVEDRSSEQLPEQRALGAVEPFEKGGLADPEFGGDVGGGRLPRHRDVSPTDRYIPLAA